MVEPDIKKIVSVLLTDQQYLAQCIQKCSVPNAKGETVTVLPKKSAQILMGNYQAVIAALDPTFDPTRPNAPEVIHHPAEQPDEVTPASSIQNSAAQFAKVQTEAINQMADAQKAMSAVLTGAAVNPPAAMEGQA